MTPSDSERLGAGTELPELANRAASELHLLRRIARLASAHLANPADPNHARMLAELLAEHLEQRRGHA